MGISRMVPEVKELTTEEKIRHLVDLCYELAESEGNTVHDVCITIAEEIRSEFPTKE
jgi:hypothetical protein